VVWSNSSCVAELTLVNPDGVLGALGGVGPGENVGELSLITGMPHPATMTALTPARILELPGEALAELFKATSASTRRWRAPYAEASRGLIGDVAARTAHAQHNNPDLIS
jgi:CRP-like cAMP-binding protein